MAKSSAGRWKIAAGKSEIVAALRAEIGEETTFAALESRLLKSPLGLKSEQIAVALCALLRGGEIAAFDARDQELVPQSLGLPLRRALHFLRPGRLPAPPEWNRVAVLTRELCGVEPAAANFVEAGRVAGALLEWRENAAQSSDLARARVAQMRRALGHSPESWAQFEHASESWGAVLEAIPSRGSAYEVLSRAANLNLDSLREGLAQFRRYEAALGDKTTSLLSLGALLQHPDLVAPPELGEKRRNLLERLGAGESALFDAEILSDGAVWSQEYAAQYAAWHAAQHDGARWNAWRRLSQSDAARSLERLGGLQNRAFGGEFRAQIEVELQKRCARESGLASGEATCSSCGLRLGERVLIGDAAPIEAAMQAELETLKRAVAQSGPREFLSRQNSPFPGWSGEAPDLLPLLSSANLRLLDQALAPRRRVTRSGAALLEALAKCAARGEIERTFALWLDGGDNLGADDEVEFQD